MLAFFHLQLRDNTAHLIFSHIHILPHTSLAADVPDDTSGLPPQKKRRSRKKRKKKDRAEEDPPTEEAEPDDSNDSADEVFHDAQSDLPGMLSPCGMDVYFSIFVKVKVRANRTC